jgi:hypothetical protein
MCSVSAHDRLLSFRLPPGCRFYLEFRLLLDALLAYLFELIVTLPRLILFFVKSFVSRLKPDGYHTATYLRCPVSCESINQMLANRAIDREFLGWFFRQIGISRHHTLLQYSGWRNTPCSIGFHRPCHSYRSTAECAVDHNSGGTSQLQMFCCCAN